MSILMKGADVAKTMKEDLTGEARRLKDRGNLPSLTIVRVGARPDDLAYERGARKRMEMIGIECKVVELPETITQAEFEKTFFKINEDPKVHGILLFRPLPGHLDEGPVVSRINPLKDVDCMCPVNIAKVFSGDETGHAPCTPEAVMEILDYYKIDPRGKKVTVIGRSIGGWQAAFYAASEEACYGHPSAILVPKIFLLPAERQRSWWQQQERRGWSLRI